MKKVVIYGNCHTESIISLLRIVPAFNMEYEIQDTLPIQSIKDPKYLHREEFTSCDLFIHQSIWEKNRYGVEYASSSIISRMKATTRVIAIPNLYHMPMCFFPQYSNEKELTFWKGETCFFRDSIIDSDFKNGKTIKRIVVDYHSKGRYSEEQLSSSYQLFIGNVRKREEEWDVKVSSFIEENYKREKLFYDPNHPSVFLIGYITEQLLNLLDIHYHFSIEELNHCYQLDSFEMPIHQDVINCFGLNIKENSIRKSINGRKVYRQEMHLKEYIKQYVSLLWQVSDYHRSLRIKSFVLFLYLKVMNRIKGGKNVNNCRCSHEA